MGLSSSSFDHASHGTYKATVFYPADKDGLDAAPAGGGPFPAVAFGHGHQANKDANTWVGKHLASRGFVCLHFSVPDPSSTDIDRWSDGTRGALDHLTSLNKTGPLAGTIDLTRAAAAGHSMGARGSTRAAAKDARIRAVVGLANCLHKDPQLPKTAAVQLQAGALDGMCAPAGARSIYDLLGPPRMLLVIKGGNHIGFIDGGMRYDAAKFLVEKGQLNDKLATISRDDQERLSRRYLTAWLELHASGDASLTPYLYGEPASRDLNEGRLSELRSQR